MEAKVSAMEGLGFGRPGWTGGIVMRQMTAMAYSWGGLPVFNIRSLDLEAVRIASASSIVHICNPCTLL